VRFYTGIAVTLLAVQTLALPARAQTGVAAVDSAAVARAAWRRAADAMRANDNYTARREVDHAASAWPLQEGYVWASAVMAARAGDMTALAAALAAYADLGLGRDLRADSSIAPFLSHPELAALATRHDRNRAPLARSRSRATLADSAFFPEGMDYAVESAHFYVASVRHRTVAELTGDGTLFRELLPRNSRGIGAILGVRVDAAHGVLWLTTAGIPQMEGYQPADSGIAALLRIRLSDAHVERRWDLTPSPKAHILGNLALGPAGDVFVSDKSNPAVYRLRPGVDTLERLTHPLFRSLQGLAPTPDGRYLYLSDYSHGLLRVELATGAVIRLDDAPGSTSLGCDDIAWDAGAIVAVQNGVKPARVMRFLLDARGARIARADLLDRNSAVADEPTNGTVIGREFVYVANSLWQQYDEEGVRKPGSHLARPVLLSVPLPPLRP
jgi:hypothetical protein